MRSLVVLPLLVAAFAAQCDSVHEISGPKLLLPYMRQEEQSGSDEESDFTCPGAGSYPDGGDKHHCALASVA